MNATLPKELKPEDVTIEQALQLIEAKGGAAPAKKSSRSAGARKAPAKKAAAKKTTAKPAAKAKPRAASKSKAESSA